MSTLSSRLLRKTFVAVAVSQLGAPSAFAQSTVPTIIVTGTKIPTPIDKTASTVTVLTSEDLERDRITDINDLSKVIPNFRLSDSFGPGTQGYLSIRGLGNSQGSWDPSATIYVDDVPYNDFFAYTQPLFNVQRVEVLKGSQATLYGGFTQAGVVDIRSSLPGLSPEFAASLDLSNFSRARTVLSASGPVAGPALRLGLALLDERGDSFFKNVYYGERAKHTAQSGRLQAVAQPIDTLEAVLTLSKHRLRDDDGNQYMPVDRASYNALIAPYGVRTGKFENAVNERGFRDGDTSLQSLRVKWQPGDIEYTAVVANKSGDYSFRHDFDFTPSPTYFGSTAFAVGNQTQSTKNRYAELRAASTRKDPSASVWLAGVSRSQQGNHMDIGGDLIHAAGSNESVFAHAEWKPGSPALAFLTGVRYEKSHRVGNAPYLAGNPQSSVDESQFLYKLGGTWQAASNTNLYATMATGWRPGGVNHYAFGTSPVYDKERTTTAEAGFKVRSDDRRWAVNAAAFYTRASGYQVTLSTGSGTGYLRNIDAVTIPGVEVEASCALSAQTTVRTALGYIKSRIDKDVNVSAVGSKVANTPDSTWLLGIDHQIGNWTLSATARGASGFVSASNFSGQSIAVSGHWVADASARYESGRYSVTAYAVNLSNREYFLNSLYQVNGQWTGQVGQPRTLGVKGQVAF
jgi:outer membrane receptor protein involved in Fe transport